MSGFSHFEVFIDRERDDLLFLSLFMIENSDSFRIIFENECPHILRCEQVIFSLSQKTELMHPLRVVSQ